MPNIPLAQVLAEELADPETRAHYDAAELAPCASANERQARADGAMEERSRIVAYLRAEAPASSARLAMLWVAGAIERGEHVNEDGL